MNIDVTLELDEGDLIRDLDLDEVVSETLGTLLEQYRPSSRRCATARAADEAALRFCEALAAGLFGPEPLDALLDAFDKRRAERKQAKKRNRNRG